MTSLVPFPSAFCSARRVNWKCSPTALHHTGCSWAGSLAAGEGWLNQPGVTAQSGHKQLLPSMLSPCPSLVLGQLHLWVESCCSAVAQSVFLPFQMLLPPQNVLMTGSLRAMKVLLLRSLEVIAATEISNATRAGVCAGFVFGITGCCILQPKELSPFPAVELMMMFLCPARTGDHNGYYKPVSLGMEAVLPSQRAELYL